MKYITLLFLLLLVQVSLSQVATPIANVIVCDDISNDGSETFDLSVFDNDILGGQNPSDFSISFHTSQSDAINGNFPLSTNFTNTTNPQTLFYRIESVNNPSNYDVNSVDLIVVAVPDINNPPSNYTFCGAPTANGISADLSQIEPTLSNLASDIVLSYYLTQQDADSGTNALAGNLLEYLANTPISIFIRADNINNNACFQTFSINATLTECDGIKMQSILDVNMNAMVDASDISFPLGSFSWEKNNSGVVNQVNTPTASYTIFDTDPNNVYDLRYTLAPAYATRYAVNPVSFTGQSIPTGSGVTERTFLITALSAYQDVSVYIIPQQQPRPGFTYTESIVFSNLGPNPVASGQLVFTYDPQLSVTNLSNPSAVINSTSVVLNYSNLAAFEHRRLDVEMQIPVIPNINLGDLLTNVVTITPLANDIIPSNNASTSSQIVIGSYDPNDKMESRGATIDPAEFGTDDYFYYTIRFENTGTASAINVRVEDTLDPQLDWNSLETIDASHTYKMLRTEDQVEWSFDDINLPDATTDPIGAHGYIYFKIKPLIATEGTVIPNKAEIYFDFNPAIITNTFETSFRTALSLPNHREPVFQIYPNPASESIQITWAAQNMQQYEINLYDLQGKRLLTRSFNKNSSLLNISEFPAGTYIIELSDGDQTFTSKIIIN